MSAFEIRTASCHDAAALSGIYRHYVENTAVSYEYEAPDAAEFERRIRDTLKSYPYLVAVQDGEVVGYAYAGVFNSRKAADRTVEASIYVAADKRRAGLGRALYARLEELLRQQNVQVVTVKIACCDREDEYLSRDSVEFHLRCGYRICGVVENCGYKFGRWYSLMIMQKDLGSFPDQGCSFIPFPLLQNEL